MDDGNLWRGIKFGLVVAVPLWVVFWTVVRALVN